MSETIDLLAELGIEASIEFEDYPKGCLALVFISKTPLIFLNILVEVGAVRNLRIRKYNCKSDKKVPTSFSC